MKKTIFLITLILILIFSFGGCGGSSNGDNPEPALDGNTVLIQGYKFIPEEITIEIGETITWINKDGARHTATNQTFDSGLLSRDESYQFTFDTEGTYDYICTPHPYMKGKIIVK